LGFTVPPSVAEVAVTEPAEPVVAVGIWTVEVVAKLIVPPPVVPALLLATNLQ
jgi:hypothetical protein